MTEWTRRGAKIGRQADGQELCEFRFTRREDDGIVAHVVQFTRKGEPGLTKADYARASTELLRRNVKKDRAALTTADQEEGEAA